MMLPNLCEKAKHTKRGKIRGNGIGLATFLRSMPRTRRPGRCTDPKASPLDRYKKCLYFDKLICWNYYQYTVTEGCIGWNPSEVGSVFHQHSSNYLLSLGNASWFCHRAHQMVSLAEAFAASNQAPPEPVPPPEARGS